MTNAIQLKTRSNQEFTVRLDGRQIVATLPIGEMVATYNPSTEALVGRIGSQVGTVPLSPVSASTVRAALAAYDASQRPDDFLSDADRRSIAAEAAERAWERGDTAAWARHRKEAF